jgi:hypothetical protein
MCIVKAASRLSAHSERQKESSKPSVCSKALTATVAAAPSAVVRVPKYLSLGGTSFFSHFCASGKSGMSDRDISHAVAYGDQQHAAAALIANPYAALVEIGKYVLLHRHSKLQTNGPFLPRFSHTSWYLSHHCLYSAGVNLGFPALLG